jgi:hypothetical protein
MNPPFNPLTRQSQIYSPLDSIESPKEYHKEYHKEYLERLKFSLYLLIGEKNAVITTFDKKLVAAVDAKIAVVIKKLQETPHHHTFGPGPCSICYFSASGSVLPPPVPLVESQPKKETSSNPLKEHGSLPPLRMLRYGA